MFFFQKFEMVMKFSFEQFYVWYQYGLTLICDKKVNYIIEINLWNKLILNSLKNKSTTKDIWFLKNVQEWKMIMLHAISY